MGAADRHAGGYDVFLSYSQAADGELAPAVQRGLERLGARWPRPRALKVFRDETGLSADASLWGAIEQALDRSSWFLLLASPAAAQSAWVQRELDHWLESNEPSRLLVAVTDGEWAWNPETSTLDGDAVPEPLRSRFQDEPRHVNLQWARTSVELDLHHARFRAAVAELAAPVHGIARDELESEHVTEQRRVRRLTRAAIAMLLTMLVMTAAFGALAYSQSRTAQQETNRAIAQTLLTESRSARSSRPDLAALAAAESLARLDTVPARTALLEALNADPLLERVVSLPDEETALGLSQDAAYIVTRDREGAILVRSATDGTELTRVDLEESSDRVSAVFSVHRAAGALAVVDHGVGAQGQDRVRVVPLDASDRGEWHVDRTDVVDVDWVSPDTIAVQSIAPMEDEVPPPPPEAGFIESPGASYSLIGDGRVDLVTASTTTSPATLNVPLDGLCRSNGADTDGTDCQTTLVAAPDAGRFAVRAFDGVGVLDHRGEIVTTVGDGGDAPLLISGDGRILYTSRYAEPIETDRPGSEGRPAAVAAFDVASGEQIWRGQGNGVNRTTSRAEASEDTAVGTVVDRLSDGWLVPLTSTEGDRLLAGNWMMGPAVRGFTSFPIRMDPLRSTFAWMDPYGERVLNSSAGAGGRLINAALTPDGDSMARLVDGRVVWLRASLLPDDLDCALAQALLGGSVPLASSADGAAPVCRLAGSRDAGSFGTPIDGIGLVTRRGTTATITGVETQPAVSIVDPGGRQLATMTLPRFPEEIAELIESSGLADEFHFSTYALSDSHLARVTTLTDVMRSMRSTVQIEWWSTSSGTLVDSITLTADATPTASGMVAVPYWIDSSNGRVTALEDGRLVEHRLDEPGSRRASTPMSAGDAGTAVSLTGADGFILVSDPTSGEPLALYGDSLEQLPIDLDEIPAGAELVAASHDAGQLAVRPRNQDGAADGLRIISTTDGSQVDSIEGPDPRAAWFAGRGVLVETDQALTYHDLRTGSVATLAEFDQEHSSGIQSIVEVDDGDVVALSSDGVRRYTIGGDLVKRVCDLLGKPASNGSWEFMSLSGPQRSCRE